MAVKRKKYKLKVNSIPKIEELLQELYNETNKLVNEVQEQINKVSYSVNLNDEPIDAKVKYSKAMNDFLTSKEKAISKKLDIAKLMSEIVKYNGNVKAVAQESDMDWDSFKDTLCEEEVNVDEMRKPKSYEVRLD